MAKPTRSEPKWIEMPSLPSKSGNLSMDPGQDYHDLGELYADAPVARGMGDVIVHRAILDDITGIPKLEDANKAGTKFSSDCTLILTEGDSAKALAMSGLSKIKGGRNFYGI